MTQTMTKSTTGKELQTKVSAKQKAKKDAFAHATLSLLAAHGYADISLRLIAKETNVALGLLSYYFKDKNELLTYAVGLYKQGFIQELKTTFSADLPLEDITNNIIELLAKYLDEHADSHRLWYDIRAQAMYRPEFQSVVSEYENSMIQLIGMFMKQCGRDDDPLEFYIIFDGLFRYFLQQKLAGDDNSAELFRQRLTHLFNSHGFSAD